jgi:hypothetical protein
MSKLRYNNDQTEIQKLLEEKRELLQVISTTHGAKQDGILRLSYQNTNGLPATLSNNQHLEETKEVLHDLEADGLAFNEHMNNLSLS